MTPSAHPWPTNADEAIRLQRQLRHQLRLEDDHPPIRTVAGLDVGFEEQEHGSIAHGAVALFRYPQLQLIEITCAQRPVTFPYRSGLLAFREIPVLLNALEQLQTRPDLLICDGHGIAHPRRFGLACHLGLLCDLPAIGCAKSRLIGNHADLPRGQGASVPLVDHGEVIGMVVRSRANVRPLYVSPGHRLTIESAVVLTLACITRYRLPEPIRIADAHASRRSLRVPTCQNALRVLK